VFYICSEKKWFARRRGEEKGGGESGVVEGLTLLRLKAIKEEGLTPRREGAKKAHFFWG
jgi:hypothetical protein